MKFSNIIVESNEDIRVDRYLRRIFPSLTQSLIEKYLRSKDILINGQKSKSNLRINFSTKIEILTNLYNSLIDQNAKPKNLVFNPNIINLADKLLNQYLLFENEYFIAIDKPEGIATQGGSKIKISVNDAINYINSKSNQNLKLVHRLDKDTSGVMLIAKAYENAAKLTKAFQERKISKIYHAITSPVPKDYKSVIKNYIYKTNNESYEVTDNPELGKYAETNYEVIKIHDNKCLIKFMPITGRTHQLRVHSHYIGSPIIGDKKYDGARYKRLLLNAFEITINKDIFGEKFKIRSKYNFEEIFNSK